MGKKPFCVFTCLFWSAVGVEFAIPLALAFLCFSFAASSVYIFNDVMDIDSDRLHPIKKRRPIASGVLKKQPALIISVCFLLAALAIGYFIHHLVLVACVVYIVQNLIYSSWLKKFALLDVTIISLGFLIRLIVGGVVSEVPVSNWMYIMTFLLAVLLAIGKRRDDFAPFGKGRTQTEKIV